MVKRRESIYSKMKKHKCPHCGSTNVDIQRFHVASMFSEGKFCLMCGHRW